MFSPPDVQSKGVPKDVAYFPVSFSMYVSGLLVEVEWATLGMMGRRLKGCCLQMNLWGLILSKG